MKIKTMLKRLISNNYQQLAKDIYKLVLSDLAYFNEEDIICLIQSEIKQNFDKSLNDLIWEIRKNGLIVRLSSQGELAL